MTAALDRTLHEVAALRAELISRDRAYATAVISPIRCPVHLHLVARDGDGQLITLCPSCATDAAASLLWMRRNPISREVRR